MFYAYGLIISCLTTEYSESTEEYDEKFLCNLCVPWFLTLKNYGDAYV